VSNPIFYIVDVFAEKKFAGNQLAVFRNCGALSGDDMQRIAMETNFSETTFILSDSMRDGGFDVRIFTPIEELQFAGHPTLGTAYVIRHEILGGAPEQITLNLKVGRIPVTFESSGADAVCRMRQIEPEFRETLDAGAVASVLGIDAGDIDTRFPVQEVSTGLPHILVPLKSLDALKRACADRSKYFNLINGRWAQAVMIFCPETHEAGNHISVRMFAECYGIVEDAATGSGNGCLAGYLVKHRYFGAPAIDIRREQGYEMGRPSLLYLRAEENNGSISISVGGKVVMIAKGEFVW